MTTPISWAQLKDEWFHYADGTIFPSRAWRFVKQHYRVMNRLTGVHMMNGQRFADDLLAYRQESANFRQAFARLTRALRAQLRGSE